MTMSSPSASEHLVIVGGSYAGLQTAVSARENGFAGRITLVSDENDLPYHRPPLSKAYLLGTTDEADIFLRSEAFYVSQGIDVVLGRRVEAIDPVHQRVALADGRALAFDALVLATGARARRLAVPGAALDGVVLLRSLADARTLRDRLAAADSVVVIGGGFIGLESAASASTLGKTVTILEAGARLLARSVPPNLSIHLANLHRRHGTDIRLEAGLARIEGAGKVERVVTTDGGRIACDLVIVGIGADPNVELAAACGLGGPGGIAVDADGRTRAATIFSAGDCTLQHNAFAGVPLRLECVQNALDQGRSVGCAIAGRPEPCCGVPRFWSDQFDTKLQTIGVAAGADLVVTRGAPEDGRFSLFHFKAGRLRAVDSINRGGDQAAGRRILTENVALTPQQAADPGFDLRNLFATTSRRRSG